jgi:hypothetical protein
MLPRFLEAVAMELVYFSKKYPSRIESPSAIKSESGMLELSIIDATVHAEEFASRKGVEDFQESKTSFTRAAKTQSTYFVGERQLGEVGSFKSPTHLSKRASKPPKHPAVLKPSPS